MGGRIIRQAIIPAAGLDTRLMPASLAAPKTMFALVDVDGRPRPVLHMMLRQAVAAGIERVAVVVAPGGEAVFGKYFRDHRDDPRLGAAVSAAGDLADLADLADRITYCVQPEPRGFGDAVRCARRFAAEGPVLVMLSDHVYLGEPRQPSPMGQVLDCYAACEDAAAVVAVAETPIDRLHLHGVVAGDPVDPAGRGRSGPLFAVRQFVEKPTPDIARRRLVTPGLREDHYLTHFGLYAFSPAVFDVLDQLAGAPAHRDAELQLTTAQQRLLEGGGRTYAVGVCGQALDMGHPAGLLGAMAALAGRQAGSPDASSCGRGRY